MERKEAWADIGIGGRGCGKNSITPLKFQVRKCRIVACLCGKVIFQRFLNVNGIQEWIREDGTPVDRGVKLMIGTLLSLVRASFKEKLSTSEKVLASDLAEQGRLLEETERERVQHADWLQGQQAAGAEFAAALEKTA
jgi:hypothetical protein